MAKRSQREPSKASLREMPEADFSVGAVRRNPYAARVRAEGIQIHIRRGRPKKGTETGPTVPKSVRFSSEIWKRLEQRARAAGMPLHAALRAAVVSWLGES